MFIFSVSKAYVCKYSIFCQQIQWKQSVICFINKYCLHIHSLLLGHEGRVKIIAFSHIK